MKKFNRRCEFKLRDAEFLLAVAYTLERIPVADISDLRAKIEEAWRLLLVNQFHDVLPGSSIELVHTEAKLWFRNSLQLAEEVVACCISYLGASNQFTGDHSLLNTLPWQRQALIYEDEKPIRAVTIPSMSWENVELGDITPVILGKVFDKDCLQILFKA